MRLVTQPIATMVTIGTLMIAQIIKPVLRNVLLMVLTNRPGVIPMELPRVEMLLNLVSLLKVLTQRMLDQEHT